MTQRTQYMRSTLRGRTGSYPQHQSITDTVVGMTASEDDGSFSSKRVLQKASSLQRCEPHSMSGSTHLWTHHSNNGGVDSIPVTMKPCTKLHDWSLHMSFELIASLPAT
eukprot:6468468-Amphidinium_carterae.1